MISTTIGLVGNESSKTQFICIVGLLYNLPSIIQAMGRIRPHRRNKVSSVVIFITENNNSKLYLGKIEAKRYFQGLISTQIISEQSKDYYYKCMTVDSVHDWLTNDLGCRFVSLSNRLGYKQNRCNYCDRCSGTVIHRSSKNSQDMIETINTRKRIGKLILERMKQKCFCCNTKNCIGICIAKRRGRMTCFHCLGNHPAKKCNSQYKSILKNKACYSCMVFNFDGNVNHDYRLCSKDGEIRERLRGLIHHAYLDDKKDANRKNFDEFLSGIYATEETFFKFLYKYKKWK